MPKGSINTPYLPEFSPYFMPNEGFDQLAAATGARFTWQKSHLCPCTFGGQLTGSPDPQCQTCKGRGWYWDAPTGTFYGIITFIHLAPAPDEPGVRMNEQFGGIYRSEPTLTIPFTAGQIWASASLNDAFVEVDAIDRFQTELQVGGIQSVPYQQNVLIQPIGAVTTYDPVNKIISPVSGYTVNGSTVTLPNTYPNGTPYIVEFTAAKTFVAWRAGGALPHDRPFQQVNLPKRFHLQQLDLWLRGSGKI